MGDDLETLCGRISLVGGEKVGIKIMEGEVAADREKGERCLVGRVGDGKKVNKEAFKKAFSQLWRTVGDVIFNEVQENIWLFEFADVDDKKRVLDGRPWSFDRQILVLNNFDGSVPPIQVQFTHSPFWIQVHDMPLICMNKGVGTKIGESLGALEDVDVAGDGGGWGRCLRLRVNIDLRNPLERGRALSLGGKDYWVSLRYERLPLLCFNCGRILHGEKGCMVKKSQRHHDEDSPKQWGAWLRAEEPRRRNGWGSGGSFFPEEYRRTDGASWRRDSPGKESPLAGGNPSQRSYYGKGGSGNKGDSCLMGELRDAVINENVGSTHHQLDNIRCDLAENQEEFYGALTCGEKAKEHVGLEEAESQESFHATMQREFVKESEDVECMNVDQSKKEETAAEGIEGAGEQMLATTAPYGVTTEAWTAVNAMNPNEDVGPITGRNGSSMRKWKRQARGKDIQGGCVKLHEMNKKKRKGFMEEVDSGGTVGTKKTRRGTEKVAQESYVTAAAAQQPRRSQ
jgi:hypothetical protein